MTLSSARSLRRGSTQTRAFVALSLAGALALEPVVAAAAAAAAPAPVDALVAPGAAPLAYFKKKKKKKKKKPVAEGPAKAGPELSVASADTKRQAIRDAAKADVDAGNLEDAAKKLEDNGALLGDPIVFLEAADLRLQVADKERDVEQAELAIESARIAADIGGFYEAVAAGSVESEWKVIDPSTASEITSRADSTIEKAEELIEAIEEEKENAPVAAAGKPKKDKGPKKPRDAKPGTAMIAAGGALTAVGVAGLSMTIAGVVISAQKQNEVEGIGQDELPERQPDVDRLDEEGNRANAIAFAGMGVAVVGFAVGIPLIVVGAKKRKKAKAVPTAAYLRLVPRVTRGTAGLALSGRF